MAKIKFSNGMVVNFNGNPTPQDIEEVANKLGINKPQPTPQAQPKKSGFGKFVEATDKTLSKASNFLFGSTSKTVGNMIGGVGEGLNTVFPQKSAVQKTDPALTQRLREKGMSDQQIKDKLLVKARDTFNPVASKSDIAFTALELYPGGGVLTTYLKKLPGGKAVAEALSKIPEGLREKAVKQYSEALGATTKELKAQTEKVVPELLGRGIKGGLGKIKSLADEGIKTSGKLIKKEENAISVFAQQKVAPIIEKANKLKSSYIVNGKIFDEQAVKHIDDTVKMITQYGDKIPETQLVKIKRLLDKSVSLANKNFTKEEGLTLAMEAKQGMANTIRNILNTKNPKLGAANKEFHLWSNVNTIVQKTIERRSTQSNGITRFIGPLIGGGAGFATGEPVKAIIGYFATDAAIRLFQSPAYKTISAVSKNKLADYIASGKIKEATLLTAKLLNGIKNEITK